MRLYPLSKTSKKRPSMNIRLASNYITFLFGFALICLPNTSKAQSLKDIINAGTASVTYGPYLRLDLGSASSFVKDGYWQSAGFPGDPQINFDLDSSSQRFGSIGVGFDWQNGYRGDVSFLSSTSSNISGLCISASDGTPCSDHANITGGSVRTQALIGSIYYSPLERRGSNSVFQPFVVAGVGLARNKIGPWTRENLNSGNPTRTYEGNTETNLAWSIGIGASWQVTRPGKWPIIVEASWKHYDFGQVSGGTTTLSGGGSSRPVQPLTFDNRGQVISLGLRIPLKRY
jgi:opacity protein-like surface antigen